jgi:hypothetical protein
MDCSNEKKYSYIEALVASFSGGAFRLCEKCDAYHLSKSI